MTKTNTQMLADLNALRVAKNLKPLKAWKESTVKLAECLAKMGGKIAQPEVTVSDHTIKLSEVKGGAELKEKIAAAKAPKAEKPTLKAAPASNNRKGVRTLADGEVHLTSIANAAKIAPKSARAIARQHKAAIAKLQVSGKKYVFPKNRVAEVRAILEAGANKPVKGK